MSFNLLNLGLKLYLIIFLVNKIAATIFYKHLLTNSRTILSSLLKDSSKGTKIHSSFSKINPRGLTSNELTFL